MKFRLSSGGKRTLRFCLVAGALGLALPAAAGSLSPQLQALASHYRATPRATLARLAGESSASTRSPFSPRVNAAGEVQVYIHYQPGDAPSDAALAAVGASDVLVSRPLGVVQAWVPIVKLEAAAALGGVTKVGLPVYGSVEGAAVMQPSADTCGAVPSGLGIDYEGVAAQNVGLLPPGITGAGVKVGILSDGVSCRAVSQAADYLPDNVWVDSAFPGVGDEGTAMLEIVHAIAPGATLAFCGTDPNGHLTTVTFLRCMDNLAAWGANVISDDIGFTFGYNDPEGRKFLAGIAAFAAAHPDVTLTSSAGNNNLGYFEADYTGSTEPGSPSGVPITLAPDYTPAPAQASNRHYVAAVDFGGALGQAKDDALPVTVAPNGTIFVILTWNDPAGGPFDDLDLFLLKPDGSIACAPSPQFVCSSTYDQENSPRDPDDPRYVPSTEEVAYANNSGGAQTLYLVALCYECTAHGDAPLRLKLASPRGVFMAYNSDGSIGGHAALAAEIGVGAAQYGGAAAGSRIENFSATGPYGYGDWLTGTHSRAKPDITGIDGVTVSGAGGFGRPYPMGGASFYGTSAASPNVGAVMALLRGFAPNAEPDAAHWKQLIMDSANADALNNYTANAGGPGLIDALAAVAKLDPPITATITAPTGKIKTGKRVTFTGECDYAGNLPLNYDWNFGDPGIPDSHEMKPSPVTYAKPGGYTVSLTCSDALQTRSAKTTIKVTKPSSGGGAFGGLALGVLALLMGFSCVLRRKRL